MSVKLRSHGGLELPQVGLGTYALWGSAGVEAVASAIAEGYTLLDSAFNYENEGAVGAAVRAAGRSREELIVTSKLPGRHQERRAALVTVEESLYRTGLDYLDLYLIHWPNPRVDRYVEAWGALIEARDRGLVKAIGVCNFLPEHLDRLQAETGVMPEVNQVELHPYFPQVEQVAYHQAHGIITQAWSPLGRGNDLLSNPVITTIAASHEATPAQVVLAWLAARGVVALPKAASPRRQRENLAADQVRLSAAQVEEITTLGRLDGRLVGQDPATYEEF